MSKTKICRKTCLKVDLENKSTLSIFVSSNMKKKFLQRIFKTQLFLKSLGPYVCVTHEILLHQSIGVTLASVEHSDLCPKIFAPPFWPSWEGCNMVKMLDFLWCSAKQFSALGRGREKPKHVLESPGISGHVRDAAGQEFLTRGSGRVFEGPLGSGRVRP